MSEGWKEINREEVFRKYSRRIERVDFQLPNGEKADFYIKAEGPAAAVVALTSERKILLVRQYRPGPKLFLNEIPGGYVGKDEDPEKAAARELLEETGYKGNLEHVVTCLDDAYSTMRREIFVATECKKVAEPQHTATEHTELFEVTIPEFRDLLRSGKMTDVEVGYLALDFLGEL